VAKAHTSVILTIKTLSIIIAVVGVVFYGLWDYLPSADPESYFLFSDQERVWGLPHFWNVFSNVIFLYVSLFGFFLFIKNYHAYDLGLWESFLILNISIFVTSWGSSYFHLNPSPTTLLWDRLPMAVGFASLFSFVFADRVTDRYVRIMLPVLSGLAVATVLSIDAGPKDLRPYIVMQFGSLLACLYILFFFRDGRLSNKLLVTSFALYALAKVCEYFDHGVFDYFFLSGHTLKHLLAGFAVLLVNVAASRVHLKIKTQRIL
jgi:hypothetical protein